MSTKEPSRPRGNPPGEFDENEPAGFVISTLNLPTSWDYIYENRRMLLRVDPFGMAYAAAYPPSDIVMFMRDRYQKFSVWPTWLASPVFASGPFTNFFRPCFGATDPATEPARVDIRFAPHRARYEIEHEGVRCITEIFVPAEDPAVCQRVTVTNLGRQPIPLRMVPVLRHFSQWGNMAPWDKPEWYTKTAFVRSATGLPGFSVHVTSPTCVTANRRGTAFWSSAEGLTGAEVSYERFVGAGTFEQPESVLRGRLSMTPGAALPWGEHSETNHLFAYPQIFGLQYEFALDAGASASVRQVFAWTPLDANGLLPDEATALRPARFLDPAATDAELARLRASFARYTAARRVRLPAAPALTRYTNEWLPLQLKWACSLDRGWPTGMRGGRDAANDFAALTPHDAPFVREMILTELSCQRRDGWVPRHFSARGHAGKERDTRQPADAGAVVLEMVHDYLVRTRDIAVLAERIPWLDEPADRTDTVFEHTLRIARFYLDAANVGEHGLSKVYEGGWLDALNKAGLKGRGEDVMLTGQVVHGLRLLDDIVEAARRQRLCAEGRIEEWRREFAAARETFRRNAREHAFNRLGYFNGFFNDEGRWLFGPEDPDGEARIYGPASYWAVISGIAAPDLAASCMAVAERLRCDAGYLLHRPAFARNFFTCGGRMTSGDSPPGRSEHGNPYNHGSHGFLARAAATAGRGDLAHDALMWLLPFDQTRHPTATALRPPYAMVNVWENIPGFRNRAKDTFLTGSTAYGLRIVYDWLLGIRPTLDGLTVDPCLPAAFADVSSVFVHAKRRVSLRIVNGDGAGSGVKRMTVNGHDVTAAGADPCSGRRLFTAGDGLFDRDENDVEVRL